MIYLECIQDIQKNQKWKNEILSINDNEGGGIKEVVVSVQGEGAFGMLKI